MTTIKRTARQIKEIHLAMFYVEVLGSYGTDGHHRLVLIAQHAREQGFNLVRGGNEMTVPDTIEIVEEPRRS